MEMPIRLYVRVKLFLTMFAFYFCYRVTQAALSQNSLKSEHKDSSKFGTPKRGILCLSNRQCSLTYSQIKELFLSQMPSESCVEVHIWSLSDRLYSQKHLCSAHKDCITWKKRILK